MGKCYYCEKEVFLREEETRCDNCGEIVRYWCNSCKEPFDVEEDNSDKVKECKWCWYFVCPSCGACSPDCEKFKHIEKIKQMVPIITEEQCSTLVSYFEEIKNGKIQKICEFGVPKTYAKDRIKGILCKMEGFKVKDMFDQNAFLERKKRIEEAPEGKTFTIKGMRKYGSYGQEERDILNFGVCAGLLKWSRQPILDKNKKKIGEYDCWTRLIQGTSPCTYLQADNLIVKYCPQCKKTYKNREVLFCNCRIYKKGKARGQYPLLQEKQSNIPTCSVLNKFIKRGENASNIRGSNTDCQETEETN